MLVGLWELVKFGVKMAAVVFALLIAHRFINTWNLQQSFSQIQTDALTAVGMGAFFVLILPLGFLIVLAIAFVCAWMRGDLRRP